MKLIVAILVVAAALGGGCYWYMMRAAAAPAAYRLAPVVRKDIRATIAASGTIEPVQSIDVGAQVEGIILGFGQDTDGKPVDYRSKVDVGTVLARIDDSLYQADLDTAKAQIASAEASVQSAQANLLQLQAKLHQAEDDWNRAQELHQNGEQIISDTDYDNYQATYESAKAAVAVGQATIIQAQRMVDQDKANVFRAQKNVAYCTISSPVKGEIIDRRVTLGETVVSSLNAPSLFLIATDLTKMQIWTAVNEADISRIYPGQPVSFIVDAYPDMTFTGKVNKIRLNATITSNVVTYTVEVDFDNKDELLLPYLTANVNFETGRADQVLTVPAAAVRWVPDEGAPAQYASASSGGHGASEAAPATQPMSGGGGRKASRGATSRPAVLATAMRPGSVWVLDDKPAAVPREVPVQVGLTDGIDTEIVPVAADSIDETKDHVIIGQDYASAESSGTNPFLPQLFGRGNRSGNGGGRTGGGGGPGGPGGGPPPGGGGFGGGGGRGGGGGGGGR